MKLKSLDKAGLLITFIIGGLFGFTDYSGPRDIVTFIGSSMVVMVISLAVGWVLNALLRFLNSYKQMSEKINQRISPVILIGLICSIIILINGLIEINSY